MALVAHSLSCRPPEHDAPSYSSATRVPRPMAPQRGRYSHERLVGPMAPPTSSDRPQVHFHQNSEGKPSKNRETLPSVEQKATTHLPRKSRDNRQIKQSQRGKRSIATIPPTGVRRPCREPTGREPRVQDRTRSAICTDTLLPFPTFPTSPPLQGPPIPSPPSSKVVVLGLQVESHFFYPVIINLVYPILFSPLSRVATIRLELPSRGVGGP